MRIQTSIKKALRLEAHKVTEVVETPDGTLVRIECRRVVCGACGKTLRRISRRSAEKRWRNLRSRDRPLALAYASGRWQRVVWWASDRRLRPFQGFARPIR